MSKWNSSIGTNCGAKRSRKRQIYFQRTRTRRVMAKRQTVTYKGIKVFKLSSSFALVRGVNTSVGAASTVIFRSADCVLPLVFLAIHLWIFATAGDQVMLMADCLNFFSLASPVGVGGTIICHSISGVGLPWAMQVTSIHLL